MIACDTTATCRACSHIFQRRNSMHVACSPKCALKLGKIAKEFAKADRKETRKRLEAIKPRKQWLAEAQQAFNAWIRARDAHLPCISCQRFHEGKYDAGHYRSTGACQELRFDEDNVHRQCVPCNRHLHGNLIAYRAGLIERRGVAIVERLEGPHPIRHYTNDQLREIRDSYRRRTRELEKQ